MQSTTIDLRNMGVELADEVKFSKCTFTVKEDWEKPGRYRVRAEDSSGTIQRVCLVDASYSDVNRALAITIAEALREYYDKQNKRNTTP